MKKLIFILIAFLLISPVNAITKKATLINDYGDKVVVGVKSVEADYYFGLDYVLYSGDEMASMFGAVASSPALFRTNLASKMTTTDTTMTLVSATTRDGTVLSGSYCFTIDGNISTAEFVCGTASGTAITAIERGLGSDGTTEFTALKFPHRYGAEVKITDFPVLQRLTNVINGDSNVPGDFGIDGTLTVSGDVAMNNAIPTASTTYATVDNELVTLGQVNSIAIQGAATSSDTTAGISQRATKAEISAGTQFDANNPHYISSEHATSTGGLATTSVPITGSDGTLDQGFIDLTEDFSFSGDITFEASTTWNILPEYDTDPIGDDEAVRKSYVDKNYHITASDNIKVSDDSPATSTSGTYEKVKEIRILTTGSLRTKFDLISDPGTANAQAVIYINGVSVGTERFDNNGSYDTWTEDFNIDYNDLIQLYLKTGGGTSSTIKNFRLYWDMSSSTSYYIIN